MGTMGSLTSAKRTAYLTTIALAALAAAFGSAEAEGMLERLPPPAETAEASVLPGFSLGAWRDISQLVWDKGQNRLLRRNYRLWDPLAEKKYSLVWIADDAAADGDGVVSGPGRLLWRKPGAASYDKDAAIAEYTGALVDGRASGRADYVQRSGATYRGEWSNGLMNGYGRLQLPNGDEYLGFFKAGRRDGAGIYIDHTGVVYRGEFAAGSRDGAGRISAGSSTVFDAIWHAGQEIPGSRVLLAAPEQAQFLLARVDVPPTVQAGLVVDRTPRVDTDSVDDSLNYVGAATPKGLNVVPDNARVINVWRGKDPIQLTTEEYKMSGGGDDFLGIVNIPSSVPFILDLQNKSLDTIRIAGGYIAVKKSVSDREPAVQVEGGYPSSCGPGEFSPTFVVSNFGWSDMFNVTLSGGVPNLDPSVLPQRLTKTVDHVAESESFNFTNELAKAGLTKSTSVKCNSNNPGECLANARAKTALKPFAKVLKQEEDNFEIPFSGSLSYQWESADGKRHDKTSRFDVNIIVGYVQQMLECGEGGTEEGNFRRPFALKADGENYRIPVPLSDDIPAGVTGRWRMQFTADMSSMHEFEVVLQLADGRDIHTPPVNLTYFKPRPRPERNYDENGNLIEEPPKQ